MKILTEDLKAFTSYKYYWIGMALIAAGAYGFAVTHYAVGMDDTAVALYYEEGLAPYVGRFGLFVMNRLLRGFIGEFAPWLVELLSVMILILSATLWCVVWKRACEPRIRMNGWAYLAVSGIFISCPLISEVFVFYLHNGICTGYGVTALAVLCLMNSMSAAETGRKKWGQLAMAGALLCIALGFYESFMIVYVMGAVMVFLLLRRLYGKKERAEYDNRLRVWILHGGITAAAGVILRLLILTLLKWVYRLDRLSGYDVQYRHLFGDIFSSAGEFGMVLKRFYVKYFVNALTYFPIRVLVAAALLMCVYILYQTVKKKDALLLLCLAVIGILPVLMSLVEGLATRYRSAQFVPLFCSFAVVLLMMELQLHQPGRWIKTGCGILLGILLFQQCSEMNKWFYADYLKYQDAVKVMNQIAYDLKKDYDISKPVIFRGAYQVPYDITPDAYAGFDTWEYRMVRSLTDPIDEHLKEKYYAPGGRGYVSAEMPTVSVLQWGVTAFDGTSQQLIRFWEMHGNSGFRCEKDLELIAEAEQIKNETNMPGYPREGYIRECEQYIIVNLEN